MARGSSDSMRRCGKGISTRLTWSRFPISSAGRLAGSAAENRIPYIVTPSFHEARRVFESRLFDVARDAARVVAFTRTEADALARVGVRPERLLIQPCGIPLSGES